MKKLIILGMATALLFMFVPFTALAADGVNLDKDYAVYLYGPDKSADKSTLHMTGSPVIYGNAVVRSGSYLLTKTWDENNITNGKLYPNNGVSLSPKVNGWTRDQVLSQGIIAANADYQIKLPQISSKTFPSLAQKGSLDVHNKEITISESGWYSSIYIEGNPNKLTIDTTGGKTIHIRADQFLINGSLNIIGNGKVYLYVDALTLGGIVNLNATKEAYGDSKQLFIYLSSSTNPVFNSTISIAGDLFAPNSGLDLGGDFRIKGNVYASGAFQFSSSAVINGLVFVPNANVYMTGSAVINGALIAKTLEMDGSAVINKAAFSNYDFLIEDPVTENPTDPTDPVSDEYLPGILGAYYDASEFKNESALRMKRIDPNIEYNFLYDSPHEVIEPESYSIKWTGYIKPQTTGYYTFKTYSDDGVKVTIDNQTVINRWGLVSLDYTIAGQTVYLEAGTYYPITLEYQQMPIFSAVFLFWEADGVPMSLVPESAFYVKKAVYDEFITAKYYNPIAKNGTGLKNTFYVLDEDGNKVQEYTEVNTIDYSWGLDAPGSIEADAFYGTMDGLIEARFTEDLTLEFIVDDGIKVWIDGVLVIDQWGANSEALYSYTFSAEAGQTYDIHIEYTDMGIGATCIMRWTGPSQETQVIPKKFLYSN